MNQGRLIRSLLVLGVFFTQVRLAHADYPAVPGEFVVKLKNDSAQTLQSASNALGGQLKRVVSNEGHLVLISRPLLETRASVLQTLNASPLVEYAEPNYIYKVNASAQAENQPNDPEFGKLWGMKNTGQAIDGDGGSFTGTPGIDISATEAWAIETGSKNVVVAVIDTGVNYKDPDLVDNIYNNTAEINGKPGVDDDNNGWVDDFHGIDVTKKNGDPMDVFGHGTHCSGTIGAKGNDNYGVAGVNWNVTILPVRFLGDDGSGNLADAVTAIDYAIKMKANIMSNSWGGGAFTQAMMDAVSRARDAGILFVAAAGNDGNDNDATPSYPASYNLDNIVSVAAMDPNGQIASFSNFGKTSVHVAAPGVDILSHTMKGLESWSGTSMATPHVSGVAALLLAHDSTMTYLDLKQRLIATSRPLAGLRGRSVGGLVNAYNALTNTVPGPDPMDPAIWSKVPQSASTAHPYVNNFKQDWTFKVPGAKAVAVHFSKFATEPTFDKVVIKDAAGKVYGTLSGNLGDMFSASVPGDTVVLSFSSDASNTDYGFDVSELAYQ